jgi:hypothetical protein
MKLRTNTQCKDLLEVVKVIDSQTSSSNANLISRTQPRADNTTIFKADKDEN